MTLDNLHLIPFLSKELNLLGHPKLPYKIKKKNNTCCEEMPEWRKADIDFSDADTDDSDVQISFNTKEMIDALVNVCNRLVKDLKMTCADNGSNCDEYDRIKYEKCSLQKKVHSLKAELEKKIKIISNENEKSRLLMVKVNELKGKVKALEKEKFKIIQQSQLNEEINRHKNKVTEKDLFELQRILHKQLNLFDTKHLPQNFQIINANYPDFKKLWSEVKYSSVNNKLMALKKAVCIFQENNEILTNENLSLKTLLFVALKEINKLVDYLSSKMNLIFQKLDEKDMSSIFMSQAGLETQMYREYICKFLVICFNIFNFLDKMSFSVNGNIFVCLSDVMNEIKNILQQ